MAWDFVAWGYLAGVALVFLRQLTFLLFKMDEFGWESINRADLIVCFAISAFFWPVFAFKRPEVLLNPQVLFKNELENANKARIRSKFEESPPYCSAWTTFTHRPVLSAGDRPPTVFTFPSEEAESTLISGGRFGPFESQDQKALIRWLELAITCDETSTEVPAPWHQAFNLVADELIYKGIGECFCPECNFSCPNKMLVPSTGSTGFGWLQNQFHCPNGHLVMSYDFIKVFCGSHSHKNPI